MDLTKAGRAKVRAKAPKSQRAPRAEAKSNLTRETAKTVAERLVVCREAKGIIQAEAARILKIKQQSLGGLERGGSKKPASDTLLDMRDRLGYSPDYVIRGKGMPLLPNFEALAQEQALILIFRELRPDVQKEAVRSVQALRRAQGGPSKQDPFQRDAPDDEDD